MSQRKYYSYNDGHIFYAYEFRDGIFSYLGFGNGFLVTPFQWNRSAVYDHAEVMRRWPQMEEITGKEFKQEARKHGYIVTCRSLR